MTNGSGSTASFSMAPTPTSPYERNLLIVYGLAILFTVVSVARIVSLLVQIELSKAMFVDHKLELEEEDTVGHGNHVNAAAIGASNDDPDGGIGSRGSQRLETEDPDCESNSKKGGQREHLQARRRRVPRSFMIQQMLTVGVLTLVIYVVLVTSAAKWYYTLSATLSVMLIILRYPIGEELRRSRYDRIVRIASLVCLIAGLLSTITFVKKTLDRGEVYEGPARIVAYDSTGYDRDSASNSNSKQVMRTDLSVSWGKEWGCPLSNGRVCQSEVKGALCEAEDGAQEQGGDRRHRRRFLAASTKKTAAATANSTAPVVTNATAPANSTNITSVTEENAELKKENEELQEEVEELKKEEKSEEDEASEEKKEDTQEETELVDEIIEAEDEESVVYEEGVEDGIEEGVEAVEEGEDIASLEDEAEENVDITEVEVEDEEKEDQDIEAIEEKASETNEDPNEEEESLEETMEKDEEEEEEDIENVEEEYSTKKGQSQNIDETEEFDDDAAYAFEDDYYQDEYWTYDWDSVWGEYGCQDLFDSDLSGQTFDDSSPPGTDEWPFMNIYGNCKTCEAYILDYFAEEAFEKVDHFRTQAIAYFGTFWIGIGASFVLYVKHLANPAAENTVELLSSDGGVIA